MSQQEAVLLDIAHGIARIRLDLYWAGYIINMSGFDLRQAQGAKFRFERCSCSDVLR